MDDSLFCSDRSRKHSLIQRIILILILMGKSDVTDHLLSESASFLETDDEQIPTGDLIAVEGDMDYRQSKPVQLGLDTAFRLTGDPCKKRIKLLHEASGRQIKIQTDAPYAVVYSAEGMDFTDSSGHYFGSGAGIALETQSMPDAVHHPELDDIRLKKQKPSRQQLPTISVYFLNIHLCVLGMLTL